MKKYDTLKDVKEAGLIAILRTNNEKEAIFVSEALIEAEFKVIELTTSISNVDIALEYLVDKYPTLSIGMGTIFNALDANYYLNKKAKFIVSPCFDKEVAILCNSKFVPYFPGCISPTEMYEATKYGIDVVKLFPSNAFNPSYLKGIKGPMKDIEIMPTGGINLDNMIEWLESGAFSLGIGGDLLKGVSLDNKEAIIKQARKYLDKYNEWKRLNG